MISTEFFASAMGVSAMVTRAPSGVNCGNMPARIRRKPVSRLKAGWNGRRRADVARENDPSAVGGPRRRMERAGRPDGPAWHPQHAVAAAVQVCHAGSAKITRTVRAGPVLDYARLPSLHVHFHDPRRPGGRHARRERPDVRLGGGVANDARPSGDQEGVPDAPLGAQPPDTSAVELDYVDLSGVPVAELNARGRGI